MQEHTVFSPRDLENNASTIALFVEQFDTQIADLDDTTLSIRQNISSEEAQKLVQSIKEVSDNSTDLKDSLKEFATRLITDIIPEYEMFINSIATASSTETYYKTQ